MTYMHVLPTCSDNLVSLTQLTIKVWCDLLRSPYAISVVCSKLLLQIDSCKLAFRTGEEPCIYLLLITHLKPSGRVQHRCKYLGTVTYHFSGV